MTSGLFSITRVQAETPVSRFRYRFQHLPELHSPTATRTQDSEIAITSANIAFNVKQHDNASHIFPALLGESNFVLLHLISRIDKKAPGADMFTPGPVSGSRSFATAVVATRTGLYLFDAGHCTKIN